VRRFRRKAELRLLTLDGQELKALSAYEWQNMSVSGLRQQEMRGILYKLTQPTAPKQAVPFVRGLQVFASFSLVHVHLHPIGAAGCAMRLSRECARSVDHSEYRIYTHCISDRFVASASLRLLPGTRKRHLLVHQSVRKTMSY